MLPFFVERWWNASEEFSKESIRLGLVLDVFFFATLVNFTNTPAKTNNCPSEKGTFQKSKKLVFQPSFFTVDILVFAGNRYLFG